MKRRSRHVLASLIGLVVSCLALGAHAADPTPAAALSVQAPAGGDLVLKGDAQCTACHTKDDAGGKTVSIGATKHGTQADGRTPTCTSCHGSSQAHATYSGSGTQPAPDMVFDATSKATAAERSNTCLACHQTEVARMHWKGSPHDVNDVACTSCHQVHAAHDDVRDKRTQATVCFSCHKDQRALANKPSHHPVLEGKMACSDCHNTHGSLGEHLLIKDTTNETCFVCHADKRGPHLWNHQPVTEDCALCHNPHGTNADSLLVTRPPFLCLSCHDPSSHSGNIPGLGSNVNTSKNAAGTRLSASAPRDNLNTNTAPGVTQGLSCMNCHADIHGSNNPVGNSTNAMHLFR